MASVTCGLTAQAGNPARRIEYGTIFAFNTLHQKMWWLALFSTQVDFTQCTSTIAGTGR